MQVSVIVFTLPKFLWKYQNILPKFSSWPKCNGVNRKEDFWCNVPSVVPEGHRNSFHLSGPDNPNSYVPKNVFVFFCFFTFSISLPGAFPRWAVMLARVHIKVLDDQTFWRITQNGDLWLVMTWWSQSPFLCTWCQLSWNRHIGQPS